MAFAPDTGTEEPTLSPLEETPTEAGESPQPEKEETGADRGYVDSVTGVRITLEDLMRAWA